MPFLAELTAATATVRRLAADVEPSCYTGPDAVRVLGVLTEAERVIAALRMLFARRVEESNVWRHDGERSAAHYLAHRTGTTVGQAIATLEVAHRLEALPATDEAFRNGELSEVQAAAVSEAAEADPAAEQALLAKATQGTVKALRDECRRIKAAACPDELARYEAIRRERHLMMWADADGAWCGRFRTTPDVGARLKACLDAETDRVFRAARAEGRREPLAAYAMDALQALVCSGPAGAPAKMILNIYSHIDHPALVRGFTLAGETCEIAGIGPVPVAVIKAWEGDVYLRLLVTHGVDIKAVTRKTRYVDPNQRAALAVRDRKCIITNCDVDERLEIDHTLPFAEGGPTEITNLGRPCKFHHFLKTKGWTLVGEPGNWRLEPPTTGPDPPT